MKSKQFAELQDSTFKIDYRTETKPTSMQNYHYHNCYELYYLCSGERFYFIKDKCYRVKKGSLVFINKYDIHYTTAMSNQGYERILINFKKEFLSGFADSADINLFDCFEKDIHIIEFTGPQQQFTESLVRTMLKEFCAPEAGSETYLKSALVQLLIIISRYSRKMVENNLGYMNSTHKTISEVTGYINNNFSENITLQSISDKFFISTYYFSRTFKRVTGLTFIDYLNSVRIKEAQKLLRKTNMSITEISEAVGFKNTTHFGRIFKKISGISPLAYKKGRMS